MRPEETVKPKFDILVTHRDERTGLVTKRDPYILRITQSSDGGKTRLWERPAGSGNLFNSKNEPVGRWIIDPKTKKGKHMPDEAHAFFEPPQTEDARIAQELVTKDSRIMALEAELAQIRAENERKTTATKTTETKKG